MKYLGSKWTAADFVGLKTLVLPSGIGEFQWVMAKLVNQPHPLGILAVDGAPRRLHQFAELHPQVHAFGYVAFEYSQICGFQDHHGLTTWEAIDAFEGTALIACNPHLEAGRHLSTWLPDLPTSYTYPVTIPPALRAAGVRFHGGDDQLRIAISCASYRGAAAWRTWEKEEWVEFLTGLSQAVPNISFAFLGGSWDDLTSEVFEEISTTCSVVTDLFGTPPIGQTKFGTAMHLMEQYQGFIGFSSGIGHVALHLCGIPVFMLWPDFQEPLSRTWVDPQHLASGKYVPQTWAPVCDILPRAIKWLEEQCIP